MNNELKTLNESNISTKETSVENNLEKTGKTNDIQQNSNKNEVETKKSKEPRKWNYKIIKEIINSKGDKKKYILASGFSPSGYIHLGTLREIIISVYISYLLTTVENKESEVKVFIDDLDSLDKIPNLWKNNLPTDAVGYSLNKLENFPDFKSISEEMMNEIILVKNMFPGIQIIFMSDVYAKGEMNMYIKKVIKSTPKLREYLKDKVSNPESYVPVYQIDQKGFVVKDLIYFEESKSLVSKNDQKAVDLFNGLGKLQWRCDWPARWHLFDVDFEPMGKDVGLSFNDCSWVAKELYKCNAPVPFIYEYLTINGGQKMSKSAGNYPRLSEVITYVPQWVLHHWLLTKPYMSSDMTEYKLIKHIEKIFDEVCKYKTMSEENKKLDLVAFIFNGKTNDFEFFPNKLNTLQILKTISCLNFPDRVTNQDIFKFMNDKKVFSNQFNDKFLNSNYWKDILGCLYSFYHSKVIKKHTVWEDCKEKDIYWLQELSTDLATNLSSVKFISNLRKNNLFECFYKTVCKSPEGPKIEWVITVNLRSLLVRLFKDTFVSKRFQIIKWEDLASHM